MLRCISPLLFATAFTLTRSMSSIAHAQGSKDHHSGNGFVNPWPSFINHGLSSMPKAFTSIDMKAMYGKKLEHEKPEIVPMDWNSLNKVQEDGPEDIIQTTWLGHACMLVRINGFNILFDPIFSGRCSPVQFMGPKRFTDPPCKLSELPKIDAVIISHNHYDHLDQHTIDELAKLHPECKFYVPLGNKSWFNLDKKKDSHGNDRVIEKDWWDSSILKRYQSDGKSVAAELKVTCTPCQHFTGRGIFDRNKTLWASWCVEGWIDGQVSKGKVFFGGDTGYRAIPPSTKKDQEYDMEYLETLPHCPVFKEIGDKIGPFDLALIPIGAYSPRWFMSPIHCSPEDSVRIHEDIKSKHSIGIHWGTFALTDEPIYEPPKRLESVLKQRGLKNEDFGVLSIGGTYTTSCT